MSNASRDENRVPTLLAVSDVDGFTPVVLWADPVTHRLLVDLPGGGTISGSGTINEITYWTGASTLGSLTVATYPSLTEISYVKGVTSAIQTQLNTKGAGTVTGSGTTNELSYWTSATAQGTLAVATYPSLTEISYVKEVTSAIQTQLNGKQPLATVLTNTTASYTTTLDTKLAGIATGATANALITGATLDALTDNVGFVTAKAISDGHNVPHAAPGMSGNVLTSNGTDWVSQASASGSFIGCRVFQNAVFSLPTDPTYGAVTFQTESFDTSTMHDNVTNNTRITITTAGYYNFGGAVEIAATSQSVNLKIRLNGTTFITGNVGGAPGSTNGRAGVSGVYQFALNDYIELLGYTNSASNTSANTMTNFWCYKIG
jgi:hypothetical protein